MKLYGIQDAPPLTLLSYVVRRELGWDRLPELARTEAGKPYFPHFPGLQFSWSHSGAYVLCVLSRRPVGVDIEIVRPRMRSLPDYAFTEAERKQYRALGADWPAFYVLWTRKEAWSKYTGLGLARLWGTPPAADGVLYGAYAGADWRAAVCGEEPPPAEIIWVDKGVTE